MKANFVRIMLIYLIFNCQVMPIDKTQKLLIKKPLKLKVRTIRLGRLASVNTSS